jgi:DNA integrity scanning protein DisA with diadenylate cyclase activity
MSEGFNAKLKVKLNSNEIDKLLKNYKKIKKYMRSSLYEIKKIDGTEKVVSELLDEYYDNPIE